MSARMQVRQRAHVTTLLDFAAMVFYPSRMSHASPDTSHYDGQDLEALADLPRYTGWILQQFSPWLQGRVLEVGAGIGNVSLRYVDEVRDVVLVEPAQNLHARLVERVGSRAHVQTANALLADVAPHLLQEPFDAAVLVNVLEHIDEDVAMLRHLHDLVKPGGAVLLFVPALPWLYGSLDELVHHVRRYTRPGLKNVIEQAGLQVQRLEYCDVLGVLPWWLVGRVLRQRRFDPRSALLYDRIGVPTTRALEGWVRPPLGKSLVAVATRPV